MALPIGPTLYQGHTLQGCKDTCHPDSHRSRLRDLRGNVMPADFDSRLCGNEAGRLHSQVQAKKWSTKGKWALKGGPHEMAGDRQPTLAGGPPALPPDRTLCGGQGLSRIPRNGALPIWV